MTSEETLDAFKEELKELFLKYDVSIDVDYHPHSDMHGVYGEGLVLVHNYTERKLCNGWCLDKQSMVD